jgi:hypothetical protein
MLWEKRWIGLTLGRNQSELQLHQLDLPDILVSQMDKTSTEDHLLFLRANWMELPDHQAHINLRN